jgi:hypothetical protein
MKALLITIAMLATGTVAQADGFRCITESGLNVKVYNHTSPQAGTRNGAIMIVSDSHVGRGNKTIASFSDLKKTLSSKDVVYTAKVDLRVSESNRKGELIGGTKLGYLAQLILKVDFSYAQPMLSGEETSAVLVLVKRDGRKATEEAVCTRYLKN